MPSLKRMIVVIVLSVVLLVLGAAVASNAATTMVANAQEAGQAQFVGLGEVNGSIITKMVDGDHVCYIVTNNKWTNVAPAIDCPQ